MRIFSRRRFKPPVFSRLTLAWLGAGLILFSFSGIALYSSTSGKGVKRIALPVQDIEVMARAATQNQPGGDKSDNTKTIPALRDTPIARAPDAPDADVDFAGYETSDTLAYPGEYAFGDEGADEFEDEIVITITGAQDRVTPVRQASAVLSFADAAPIPDPPQDMLRKTPLGFAPRISNDGRRAMNFYAHGFSAENENPKIAVIVGGLGLNPSLTERAISELPPQVSLGFAPYARNLKTWTKRAREAGHEILIELPMQGYGGYDDALGEAALLTSRSEEENLQRLDWLMSRFGGYFAATNYQGAQFSADRNALAPILTRLAEAGVAYIDDTGAAPLAAANSGAIAVASRIIAPAANKSETENFRRELLALEQLAQREDGALAKTYASPATLDEIIAWAHSLDEKELILAPASAFLQDYVRNR